MPEVKYDNKSGVVNECEPGEFIEIDNTVYFLSSYVFLYETQIKGDTVEFNANSSGEIIYLKNTSRRLIGSRYREGRRGFRDRDGKIREGALWGCSYGFGDPNDPDEIHDMEMMYGHDFEGM